MYRVDRANICIFIFLLIYKLNHLIFNLNQDRLKSNLLIACIILIISVPNTAGAPSKIKVYKTFATPNVYTLFTCY